MSGEKYVTASAILPVFHQIILSLFDASDDSQADKEFDAKLNLQKEIMEIIISTLKKKYIEDYEANILLLKCTYIDPRFKLDFIDEECNPTKIDVEDIVKKEILEYFDHMETAEKRENPSKKPKTLGGLSAIFNKNKSKNVHNFTPEDICNNEIYHYRTLPRISFEEDPLVWWQQHESALQKLSLFAGKYLCLQATSVPSERVFSKGGNIVNDLRSSLTSEHAEQLIFLSMNKEYVPKIF